MSTFYAIEEDFSLKKIFRDKNLNLVARIQMLDKTKHDLRINKIKGTDIYVALGEDATGPKYYILDDLTKVGAKIMKRDEDTQNVPEKMVLGYTPITTYPLPQNLAQVNFLRNAIGIITICTFFAVPMFVARLLKLI